MAEQFTGMTGNDSDCKVRIKEDTVSFRIEGDLVRVETVTGDSLKDLTMAICALKIISRAMVANGAVHPYALREMLHRSIDMFQLDEVFNPAMAKMETLRMIKEEDLNEAE